MGWGSRWIEPALRFLEKPEVLRTEGLHPSSLLTNQVLLSDLLDFPQLSFGCSSYKTGSCLKPGGLSQLS